MITRISGSAELEREDCVHAEEGLAGLAVFVEACEFFIPNPAYFWANDQVRIELVIHTESLVVSVSVDYTRRFARNVVPL